MSHFITKFAVVTTAIALSLLSNLANAQNLFVGSYFGSYVSEFTPSGTNLGVFASSNGTSRFGGIAFDANGYLYAAGVQSYNLRRFSPTGTDLGDFVTTPGNWIIDVAFDKSGNLYISNYNADVFSHNGNIHRYSPTGADLGIFASIERPQNIAFDSSGNLYVVSGGTVHRFSSTGQDLGVFTPGTNSVYGLTFDSADNLYLSIGGTHNGYIERYSSAGTDLGIFTSSNVDDPRGLAFDTSGNLYVDNYSFGNGFGVRKYSATGVDLGYFATGINAPVGLVFQHGISTAVPEPGSIALLLAGGMAGAGWLLRRKRVKRGI